MQIIYVFLLFIVNNAFSFSDWKDFLTQNNKKELIYYYKNIAPLYDVSIPLLVAIHQRESILKTTALNTVSSKTEPNHEIFGKFPILKSCGPIHRSVGIGQIQYISLAGTLNYYLVSEQNDYGANFSGTNFRTHFNTISKKMTCEKWKNIYSHFFQNNVENQIHASAIILKNKMRELYGHYIKNGIAFEDGKVNYYSSKKCKDLICIEFQKIKNTDFSDLFLYSSFFYNGDPKIAGKYAFDVGCLINLMDGMDYNLAIEEVSNSFSLVPRFSVSEQFECRKFNNTQIVTTPNHELVHVLITEQVTKYGMTSLLGEREVLKLVKENGDFYFSKGSSHWMKSSFAELLVRLKKAEYVE